MTHSHIIPNSFYSPEGGVRLLSPQHWAQAICKNRKVDTPPSCITTGSHVILKWGNGKYCKTIPLGIKDNVATMYSDPGYDRFHAFCAEAEISLNDDDNIILCNECTSVLEDKDTEPISATTKQFYPPQKSSCDDHFDTNIETNDPITSQFQIQQKIENRSLELLHIHNKYGHISFARLREMAKQGIIHKYHATTPTPACAACLYGRATRRQ